MRPLAALATLSLALIVPATASAQDYPNRPIRIIVAYPAGQGTDIATRYLAEQMSRDLGQPVVIDNKPGAGGNIGTALTLQAPADGYTLTMGTNATHALNQYLYNSVGFDAEKDFEPIALVGTFPMVVAVNPASPFNNIADVLATVNRNARGSDIAMPSTTARLVVELLKKQSGAPLYGVPYRGSANAMSDLLGGQLPIVVDTPTALRPHLAAGKVRAIGVTSSQPSGLVPGVKPVAEQGVAGFEVLAWNALYAPKGTPAPVISILNTSLNKVLARPETKQKLLELGFDPAGGTPARLAAFAKGERTKWEPIIQAAGLKVD